MPKGGSNGKQFHLEFAGFTPGILHPKSIVEVPEIKQADVILLGYPLDMQMSAEIRQNDLQMYRKVVYEEFLVLQNTVCDDSNMFVQYCHLS